MFSAKLLLFVLGACLAREAWCSVRGPKDSASGLRGTGQIMPQVFDLGSMEELQDIASQFNGKDYPRIQKRQADLEDPELDLSTAAILTNDSHIHAIVHWTGYPRENIFILTRQPGPPDGLSIETWLWRSTDYGTTFINDTDKLEGYLIQSYYVGVNTSYLIFAGLLNRTLQVTEDYGETFTARSTPFTPHTIIFQSRRAPNSIQYSKYIISQDFAEETLWVSTDLGINWRKIGDDVPVNAFYWRRLEEALEGDLSTIYFEQRTSKGSNESLLYFSTYPYTEIQIFAPELGPFESGTFVLEHEYMFVRILGSAVNSNVTYSSPLWVSYRRDRIFRQTQFPFLSDELEHLHYTVIDASEGEVLVGVYHNNITANLYISDVTGTSYSLSLDFIITQGGEAGHPAFDVHLVDGIRGAVLANRQVPGGFGGTVISHNKGGQWSALQAPAVDRNSLPINCMRPGCSLHLRMDSDIEMGHQAVLSQDTAVGLIMAAGNLGTGIVNAPGTSRIYISRDGGFTWAEVESGRWEFQILALGSIIVMVNKQSLVDDFKWSCDEGATWMTNKLEEDMPVPRLGVIGMKTEIGEKPRLVTVFGVDYYQFFFDDVFEWIVFTLNFTSVVPRQCDTFDYFEWVPTDERLSESCLLGEVVQYERRNASACCYVDPDYQKPVNTSRCRCSLEDFECDLGFARQTLNSPCTPVPGHVYPPPAPLICPERDNYTYSSGYRKIPGDKCEEENINVDFLLPQTASCPLRAAGGLSIDFFTPESIQPNQPVTFTLSQSRGSKLSTVYMWSFDDSTPSLEDVGLISAQTKQHSFASPGVYSVTVNTRNDAGVSEITISVSVLDTLIGFSVDYPSELYNDTVPIGFYIQFTASISTQYGAKNLGEAPYELAWDFGDGTNFTADPDVAVGHVYESPGTFIVSTSVAAVYSEVDKVVTKSIRTYEAATTVNITSNARTVIEGIAFFQTKRPVTFQLSPPPNTEIPPQTTFTWQVRGVTVGSGRTLVRTFPVWGQYVVTMRGSYLTTGSVQGIIVVTALDQMFISYPAPTKQTARSGQPITLGFFLRSIYGKSSYQGPINVTLESQAGSILASHNSIVSEDPEIKLHFTIKKSGSTNAILRASNGIFHDTTNLNFIIVGSGEFETIRILFDTERLPSNYDSPEWQEKLSHYLGLFIAMKFNGDASLIEVVGVSTLSRVSRKRSSGMFLAVDVNLLPADYTQQDFQDNTQMADKVLADIAKKNFTFNVDDDVLTADSAYDKNNGPSPVQLSNTANPVVDIVLAVVFTIILIIVIVVVVIIVVYCYRRNKELQLKYSKMEETAGGNLSFNEAFGESVDTKESGNE